MNFIVSDFFTDSLAWLTDAEQKAVKTTAFELQLSTINYSLSTGHQPPATDLWTLVTDHYPLHLPLPTGHVHAKEYNYEYEVKD